MITIENLPPIDIAQIEQPSDELLIMLKKPVILGGETYTEMRLREPTGAEMIACDTKRGWEHDVAVIALISGIPEPAAIKIGAGDLNRARKFLDHFFD
ncbi:MAG: phage tail assembly protein [Methylovirgula sp.]|nr:phage tail assembly protein [Methylovirgula sp.]